ncbi:MAG TPA: transcriptional repressor [bacterium]
MIHQRLTIATGERPEVERLQHAVRGSGGRLTATTVTVYQFLLDRTGPVTIEQIAEGCRKTMRKVPHMVSLYRITHRLEELGFVRKVILGDGVVRFEASDVGHHHHVVCTQCGRIAELDICGMEVVEKYVREVLQFNQLSHTLEYRGVCAECVPARPAV